MTGRIEVTSEANNQSGKPGSPFLHKAGFDDFRISRSPAHGEVGRPGGRSKSANTQSDIKIIDKIANIKRIQKPKRKKKKE